MSDICIKVDVPERGTLEVSYSMNDLRLRLYKGSLAQIIISSPVGPEAKFTMPAEDFVILFAKFFKSFGEEPR